MSARDYKLVVRIEVDRASLDKFVDRLNDAIQKAFNKALKNLKVDVGRGRGAAAGGGGMVDQKLLNELSRLSTRLAGLQGEISRMVRVMGRGRRAAKKRDEGEEEERRDWFSVAGRVLGGLRGGGALVALGAIIGVFSAIGEKIIELLEKLVQMGTQFSGIAQSSFKLLYVGISLLFKPIADIFGLLLRPLAKLLIPVALALNKFLEPFITKALQAIDKVMGLATGGGAPAPAGTYFPVPGSVEVTGTIDISEASKDIQERLKEKAKEIADAVGEFLRFFAGFISPAARLGVEVGKFLTDVFTSLEDIGKRAYGFFSGAWNTLVDIGKRIWDALSGLWEWFKGIGDAIAGVVGPAWDNFVKWVKENIGKIADLIGKAWSSFVEWINDNLGKIADILGEAWNEFVGWVIENFGKIAELIGEGWEAFVNWIKENIGKIAEWVGRGWEDFVDWIKEVGRVVNDTLKPIWDGIVSAFERFWDKISWVGEMLGIVPRRGQFGLDVRVPGPYFLEAGEMVLSRSDVMRLLSFLSSARSTSVQVSVNISGPVFGINDLERKIEEVVRDKVGNILYDLARKGVR
ncbi:MAG: hypothetical protein QXI60_08500 [Thermofilaceae archaeon]